jgi:NitT/TauT family transport system substrate-binding protein
MAPAPLKSAHSGPAAAAGSPSWAGTSSFIWQSTLARMLLMLLSGVTLAACISSPVRSHAAITKPSTLPAQNRMGLTACDTGTLPSIIVAFAQEAGLFEKYGLSVKLLPVAGGSGGVMALLTGDADICTVGGSSVVSAALAGEDLILTAGIINRHFFALVVRSEIETAQDLRGKILATGSAASSSDRFLRMALELLNLEPGKEITIVNGGRSADRLAAMEAGQVAGAAIAVPELPVASKLDFHLLFHASELNEPYQHTAIATSRAYLYNNRRAVTAFTQAIIEATARMQGERAQTIQLMAHVMRLDPVEDKIILAEAYAVLLEFLPQAPYPTREGIQVLIDVGRAENPLAVELTPDDLVDDSIVRELEESGFIDNLYIEK